MADLPILVEAFTAAGSLNSRYNGALVTNRGATGSVTVTLPAGERGISIKFQKITAQTFTVARAGSDTILDSDGSSQTSIAVTGTVELSHDGTSWVMRVVSLTSLPTDAATLLGVTAGLVVASEAVVVDSNKDIGDFRNVDCVNLDAGSSGTAGTVEVFPTTAAKGKFALACQDQDADTLVTLQAAGMAQASVISIPDPGAATANVMLTNQANDQAVITAASTEINVLTSVTPGTSAVSKALVLDSGGDLIAGPVILADMTPGTGADGAASIEHSVVRAGGLFITTIVVDLAGLNSGGTAGDIIGENPGVANCHIGQISSAKNGTIFAGKMTCLEAPATGSADIDIYAATEATGAEDVGIGTLTASQLCNSGVLAAGTVALLTAFPADSKYLYLVDQAGTDATYTAGILLIELYGK